MRPAGAAFKHPYFYVPVHGPSRVALSVTKGGKTVARATLSRRVTPDSVRVRELTKRRDGVVGLLFTPKARTRRPAAVVFGGSEGGNYELDAAGLLAAHGYPTLSLAYFREPGLPKQLGPIPVERIAGPVLTAGAGDDRVWSSRPSVEAIEHRLTAHHFRYEHHGLVYEQAGHDLGTPLPWLPAPTTLIGVGGTARADAAAKADLWRHILAFFARQDQRRRG